VIGPPAESWGRGGAFVDPFPPRPKKMFEEPRPVHTRLRLLMNVNGSA
jgi:hypothetical protein